MMSAILKNQPGARCYLDDVIVFGGTPEEHDKNLRAVLQRIDAAGLKLNLSKCHFRQTELSFIGNVVSHTQD